MTVDPALTSRMRKGSRRRAIVAHVRSTQPTCWICGRTIDPTIPTNHPLGSTVDEIVPLSLGGNPLDPANCMHACRVCNSTRGNGPVTPALRAKCRAKVATLLTVTVRADTVRIRDW